LRFGHARRHLCARSIDRNETRRIVLVACFRQKKLNNPFGFVVVAFAEMVIAPASLRIDEIVRGPIFVVEGSPDGIVAVDGNRISDLKIGDRGLHIADLALERKFRRVHPDHDQSVILLFLCPCFDIGNCTQAVDARVSPKVDQDDFASQAFGRERR
jgi:hypothetical protein